MLYLTEISIPIQSAIEATMASIRWSPRTSIIASRHGWRISRHWRVGLGAPPFYAMLCALPAGVMNPQATAKRASTLGPA